jgi:hypothetical protein
MFLSGRKGKVVEATIAKDASLSGAADLKGHGLIGLIIPTIDSANISFQVSDSLGGAYVDLKDKAGDAITVTAGTGGFAVSADDLGPLAAYRFVKVKASAAQTPAAVTLKFILKV